MNSETLSRARAMAPMLIVGASILASALIWLPRGTSDTIAAQPALGELGARFTSGSERLAGLIEVTNDRPVFHASRRPVEAPEAPPTPEPVLSLLGVISDDDGETLAFLKLSTTGALYRIAKGETVGRWRILDIGTETVSVSKDGGEAYTLRIGG